MLLQPIAQTERALRDTVVGLAEGAALDRLSSLWGAPRPAGYERSAWRKALQTVALGARGTPGVTMGFLLGALSALEESFAVTLDPSAPQRITAAGGAGAFTQLHVGRMVLIDGVIYRTVGPQDVATDGGGAYLDLARVGTSRWAASDWSGLDAVTSATARFPIFDVEEPSPGPVYWPNGLHETTPGEPCLVEVRVFGQGFDWAPATYVQTAGEDRPAGQPFGGHVQADALEGSDTVLGPHPPYLTGGEVLASLRDTIDLLLAAGVRVRFVRAV